MPRQIEHHGEILEAIRQSGILSELLDTHEGHYKYELDLELIVYGRTYADKRVGPYVTLFVYETGEEIIREGQWGGNSFYILVEGYLDVYVKDEHGIDQKVGKIERETSFGEMSVLAGQPRNATVTVPREVEAKVLRIERPAIRLLRKLKTVGQLLEDNYRRHGVDRTLLEIQDATHNTLNGRLLEYLKSVTRFTVFAKDHILFREGDPVQNLIFINNGWVRRVRGIARDTSFARSISAKATLGEKVMNLDDEVGLDFLGAGNWLGLNAVFAKQQESWNYSATVLSRTEALEISIADLKANPQLLKAVSEYFPQFSEADDRAPEPPVDRATTAALANEISTGVIDGTNVLVMDMDLCIRCGNCSLACHRVHGQSRLLRRGIHISRPVRLKTRSTQHVLSPSVCLHCQDPECLTGCPTGAIARFSEGQIDIDPQTCIGCADCATQCPFNAISMVPRMQPTDGSSGLLYTLKSGLTLSQPAGPSPVTATEDLLAVKCNLCENTSLNPPSAKTQAYSCQENCPTGALVRVNPSEYFDEARNAIGIVFKDRTHAIGRNIHKQDLPARVIHAIAVVAILGITSIVFGAAEHFSLDSHFRETWLTMRWITGLIGLGSIVGAVSYSPRKQIYKRRVGPLRHWKLVHVYLGVLAGIVLLIHGGRDSGGLLTSMLMIAFDVVIVSGLFGALSYFLVPRLLTSIEGDPLLIEDLRTRRGELTETLGLIDTSNPEVRHLVKNKMRQRFFSFGYLLRQYVRREELTTMLAEAREEFREDAETLNNAKDRRIIMEAVEATATLRRVDSLIYLHQLLKLWLAPHVVAASIMLALMCVHIVQVVLFTVR